MSRTALLATLSMIAATALPALVAVPSDARPTPKPRLTAPAVTVAENTGRAVVSLTLSKKARKTVKVAWAAKDGTAVAGADYTAASGTVKIKMGKKAGKITIPVLDGTTHEQTETFTVTLTSKQARVPKPVTVTITDNDAPTPPGPSGPTPPPAPTAPSALTGTIAVTQTHPFPSGTTTLNMSVRLVPTGVSGEWRDNGTGTWTISGSLMSFAGMCPWMPSTTSVSGAGTFLTAAGEPASGQAAMVLSGFDPAGATGSPALTWQGKGIGTTPNWIMDIGMPGVCLPGGSTVADFPFGLAAPGATASYTGTTGPTRGVLFGYDVPGTLSVTGVLVPVA